MNESLGQIAYNAYCNSTNWKSLISGAALPQWPEVKLEIKTAWEAAAEAVKAQLAHDSGKRCRCPDCYWCSQLSGCCTSRP